ncbi:DNA/RNA non-specific endonuclease [Paenalcaligenes niemegkensis]|uniref:DNA/RNA non-specific endonuclease n=1 Tax=Paenalcaligenes niemegkensis TaxID=2895469 RepID=UPI001EE7D9C8|nr:DNA/RNA non-specific endonuclease [Paenalcaligenes niemegkensis]MCQ9616492.1 DNA/RNA non-specific endonuclease [Paenalcaligenes niemegkensis]
MSIKKKTAPRKRSTARKTTRTSTATGSVKRFLSTVSASAVIVFGIASYLLNPQLRDGVDLGTIIAQLDWPLLQQEQHAAPAAVATNGHIQTVFSQCPQFFPANKPPIVPAGRALRELCFSSFAILHSGNTKTPVFVAQRLNRQMIASSKGVTRTDKFYAEARLPQADRAQLNDYRGSGYSRGHMAPAGDMHSADAMAQSFSLANMVPQNQRHNAGAWSKIESDTRKYAERATGDVYIFTGPFYNSTPDTIGEGRVAIPSHLYKVVYDASTGRSWVHWHIHSPDTKAGAPISYEEFVRRTGLHLLPLSSTSRL